MTKELSEMPPVATISAAILQTIRDFGDKGVPEGYLYAPLLTYLTAYEFETVMSSLERVFCLKRLNHVVYWTLFSERVWIMFIKEKEGDD